MRRKMKISRSEQVISWITVIDPRRSERVEQQLLDAESHTAVISN